VRRAAWPTRALAARAVDALHPGATNAEHHTAWWASSSPAMATKTDGEALIIDVEEKAPC
jgi:hypothetical protein